MSKKDQTPKKPKKPGPPPVAQDKLTAYGLTNICDLIICGTSYREIAKKVEVGLGTLVTWMEADPERSQACARARELGSQSFDEEALEAIEAAASPLDLAKAREKAIHLRWRAKAANPRRYGDKVAVGGAADLPPIRQESDLSGLTDEELTTVKRLLVKAKTVLESDAH